MENPNVNTIDIERIAARRKADWLREHATHKTLLDHLDSSIPWWVLIIGIAAFVLSAQHTIDVFSRITPVSAVAPLLVEFTLLWGAFSRVKAASRDEKMSRFTRAMEIVAFIVSVIVNFVGAVTFVQSNSNVGNLSFAQLSSTFGSLPLPTQAALLISPLFALFIPGSAVLGGEGIAAQIADYRRTGGALREQWARVQLPEVMQAIYAELVRTGQIADARRESYRMATGYLGVGSRPTVQSGSTVQRSIVERSGVQPERSGAGVERSVNGAAEQLEAWLNSHPEHSGMSQRAIARAAQVSVGTVNSTLKRRGQ